MREPRLSKGSILLIDAQPSRLGTLTALLTEQGHHLQSTAGGELALQTARNLAPDLILLGADLAGMDAYETCRRLKADASIEDVPVLFVDPHDRAKVFAAGGADWIGLPLQAEEVLARVATHLDLRAMRERAKTKDWQQNDLLTTVLDSLTHPFYVVDAHDYTIQIANPASRMWHRSGQATCYALTHDRSRPCDTASHPCPVEEIKATKQTVTVEHVHLDRDGNWRNVEVHGYPILDEKGRVAQIIEYSLDITERKQAEEALRESEARWRSVADNSPDHVLLLDVDLRIEYANHASPGRTVEEVIGKPLYAYLDGAKQAEIKGILEKVLKTGEPTSYEVEYAKPHGNSLCYESHVARRTQDEKLLGLTVTARDISEHKRTEAALRLATEAADEARRQERERRVDAERRRQIAESLADVLEALNSNQPLKQILSYIALQARQLLGNKAVAIYRMAPEGEGLILQAAHGLPDECTSGRSDSQGLSALQRAVSQGQYVTVPDLSDAPLDRADEARSDTDVDACAGNGKALLAVPITTDSQVYGGILLHYTEGQIFAEEAVQLASVFADQVALAIENARLREEVGQAATMAERSRLARDLHDSVTQALFSATLVAEVLPQVWHRDPEEALEGVEELRYLTRSALAEMRTMLLELRPTALLETRLDDLLRQLTEAITSRTQLEVMLNVEPVPTLTPKAHVTFYRVAQESLQNAVKHARANHITVSLRSSPPVSSFQAGEWQGQVILQVSDDGQGYDPDQTRPDQMGLRIMRERAEAVGGMLAIESQPGQGTQVTLVWARRQTATS